MDILIGFSEPLMECPMTQRKAKRFLTEAFKGETVERVLTSGSKSAWKWAFTRRGRDA